MDFSDLSHHMIGCAIEGHRTLGPGLLKWTYEQCLAHELKLQAISFLLQHPLPVEYRGLRLDCGYRVDILVVQQIIMELKSVEHLLDIHEAQRLTDMKLADLRHGFPINFNAKRLKDGLGSFIFSCH